MKRKRSNSYSVHGIRFILNNLILEKAAISLSSWPVTGLWNRGPLNGIKLIVDDQGNHLDSYIISLESFRSPILQTSNWSGNFFAVSYSKPALIVHLKKMKYQLDQIIGM